MRKSASFALALLLTIQAQSILFAQTRIEPQNKPPEKEDVVRITSNLVQIDVSVTDKKGRPVADLKDEDFEIYEDGRPQKITNFSFVSGGATSRPAPGALSGSTARNRADSTATDVAPAPPERLRPEQVQRTVALVVDDLGLSFESVHFVRLALKKFVDEQMQPGDLVAIIRTGAGVGALQQFTSDKRVLYAAIERVKWNSRGRGGVAAFAPIEDNPLDDIKKRPAHPGSGEITPQTPDTTSDRERTSRAAYNDFKESIFSVGTLGALNYIIRGLRNLPGRKSVVLLSDSIALFDSNDSNNFRTVQAMRRLTDLANRASVVIYTIDPRGIPPLNLTAADNTTGLTTLGNGAVVPASSGPALMQTLNSRTNDYWKSQNGLGYLALQTGGFFVFNNNDVGLGIKKVLDDSKSFYLIGYRPEESTFDAQTGRRRFHEISVKLKRPDLVVRTRTGFFGFTNDETRLASAGSTGEQLMNAIASPFASGDIDLRLTSIFLSEPENGSFMRSFIYVDGHSLKFEEQPDGSYKSTVDVLAMTFDDGGMPVDNRLRTESVTVKREQYRTALQQGLIFGINLPVKRAGAFQLRIAVRDAVSGRVGSANQYIEVPDVKKDRLTLSGIYLAEHEVETANNVVRTNASGDGATMTGGGGGGGIPDMTGERSNSGVRSASGELNVAEHDPQSGPAVRRFRSGSL
ncbi:MAG: VWA domain-containing protein, partial [Pyrinomonadaceae bacterium]